MSAVSSMYHVVINTYRRQMTIPDETSEHLYRYIWSIVKSRFEALSGRFAKHQAAWVFDPLAWCFPTKSGLRPAKPLRGTACPA